jgi:hypothetical protein
LPVAVPLFSVEWRFHPEGMGIIQPSVAPKAFGATLGSCTIEFINPARVE